MNAYRSTRIRIDQALAQSIGDEFGSIARAGFAHDAGTVAINGLDADAQRFADFAIGMASDNLAENLPLTIGERFEVRTVLQHAGEAAANDASAFEDAGKGACDFPHIVRFAEHTVSANLYQFGNLAARFDPGEDHNARFGRPTACFQQHLGPSGMRHGYIQHQEVGAMLANGDNGIDTIVDRLDNLDLLPLQSVLVAERRCKRVPDDRVVIRNDCTADLSEVRHSHQLASSPKAFAFSKEHPIRMAMGGKSVLNRLVRAITVLFALIAGALASPTLAGTKPPVAVEPGRSHEMVEGSARYLVTDVGAEIGVDEALAQFRSGAFAPELAASNKGEFHDWRVWIALPFESASPAGAEPMRRVIGIGGIFVKPPRVYLTCGASGPREILATQTSEGGPLSARYFTYVRSQSFTIDPQQSCLALINTASSDNPNIGIFREGELGTRQVIAVLLKGGFTATLLIIGLILAIISYLTSRPLGVLIGITYSLAMIQNEASLFTTTLIPDPLAAREVWENITLLTVFSMLSVFLFGFRKLLRLENSFVRTAISILVMLPLIVIARSSNATPDIIWALYLGLFLFALTAAVHFDIARPLRFAAGGILIASAIGAVLIEPYYLGRDLSDLTIEWFRDAIRLFAGLGMLLLLLVDVLQTRRERARMFAERIEALETQAETDRRLLEAEREYARAREAATRTKAQLAAASHDIRQPIVGLRAALGSEAERLSPGLQARLGQAIDYLEHLTREYSDREEQPRLADPEQPTEAYPLNLITRAVENMFAGEARQAGVTLHVEGSDCPTQVPALALIRATSNLVANALRHADAGTIRVTAEREGEHCQIMISDDGAGMDAATLAQVQQAGSKSQQSDGDGLGLAIVHELAARHGLEFTMASHPGEGTMAKLTLPDHCG